MYTVAPSVLCSNIPSTCTMLHACICIHVQGLVWEIRLLLLYSEHAIGGIAHVLEPICFQKVVQHAPMVSTTMHADEEQLL